MMNNENFSFSLNSSDSPYSYFDGIGSQTVLNDSSLSLGQMNSSIQPSPDPSPPLASSSEDANLDQVTDSPPPLPTYPSQEVINMIRNHIPEFISPNSSSSILSDPTITCSQLDIPLSNSGCRSSSSYPSYNDSIPSDIDLNPPSPTVPSSFSMSAEVPGNDYVSITSGLVFHETLHANNSHVNLDESHPTKYLNRNPFARFATQLSNEQLQPFAPPTPTLEQRHFQIEPRRVPEPQKQQQEQAMERSRSLNHSASMPALIGAELQRRAHIRRPNPPRSLRSQPASDAQQSQPTSVTQNTSLPNYSSNRQNFVSQQYTTPSIPETLPLCSLEPTRAHCDSQSHVQQQYYTHPQHTIPSDGLALSNRLISECYPEQVTSQHSVQHQAQCNSVAGSSNNTSSGPFIPSVLPRETRGDIRDNRLYYRGPFITSTSSYPESGSNSSSSVTLVSSSETAATTRQVSPVTPPLSPSSGSSISVSLTSANRLTSSSQRNDLSSGSSVISGDNIPIMNIIETTELFDNSNAIIIQQQQEDASPLPTPPSTPIITGYPSVNMSSTVSTVPYDELDWDSVYIMEIQPVGSSRTDSDSDTDTDSTSSMSTASTGTIEYFEDEPPEYNDLFSISDESSMEEIPSAEPNAVLLTQDQLEQELQDFLEQLPPTPKYTKRAKQGEISIPNHKAIDLPTVNEQCNQPREPPPDYSTMTPELEPYIMRPAFSQNGGDTRNGRNTAYFLRPPSMIIEE